MTMQDSETLRIELAQEWRVNQFSRKLARVAPPWVVKCYDLGHNVILREQPKATSNVEWHCVECGHWQYRIDVTSFD